MPEDAGSPIQPWGGLEEVYLAATDPRGKASAGIETVEPIAAPLREWGHVVAGEAFARDSNGVVFTRVAWIDGPGRRGSEG